MIYCSWISYLSQGVLDTYIVLWKWQKGRQEFKPNKIPIMSIPYAFDAFFQAGFYSRLLRRLKIWSISWIFDAGGLLRKMWRESILVPGAFITVIVSLKRLFLILLIHKIFMKSFYRRGRWCQGQGANTHLQHLNDWVWHMDTDKLSKLEWHLNGSCRKADKFNWAVTYLLWPQSANLWFRPADKLSYSMFIVVYLV